MSRGDRADLQATKPMQRCSRLLWAIGLMSTGVKAESGWPPPPPPPPSQLPTALGAIGNHARDQCASWLLGRNPARWCDVSPNLSYVVVPASERPLPVALNSELELLLVTMDAHSRMHCTTGGASFSVGLIGPALLPGKVIDLSNGSYAIHVPWTGLTPGNYSLSLLLEFNGFEGSTRCDCGRYELGQTRRIIMRPVGQQPVRIQLRKLPGAPPLRGDCTGYWTVSKGRRAPSTRCEDFSYRRQSTLVPLTTSVSYSWLMYQRECLFNDLGALAMAFAGRWIHFVGKSTMETSFDAFANSLGAAMQHLEGGKTNVRRLVVPGSDSDKWMDDQHPCASNSQRKQIIWWPSTNTLLTSLCHDVPRGLSFNLKDHFKCLHHVVSRNQSEFESRALNTARQEAGPDSLVYNRGLHVTATFNNRAAAERFYAEELHVMSAFAALERNGTLLIWKSTPSTHFEPGVLNPAWMCRTTERIGCINAIAQGALASSGARWRVADMHSLAFLRPDCQPDNRHNRCGNCGHAFADVLFGMMAKDMRPRTPDLGPQSQFNSSSATHTVVPDSEAVDSTPQSLDWSPEHGEPR